MTTTPDQTTRIPYPSEDGARGVGGTEDAARILARKIANLVRYIGWREGELIELCEAALQSPTDREGDRLLAEARDILRGEPHRVAYRTELADIIDTHLSRSIVGEGE